MADAKAEADWTRQAFALACVARMMGSKDAEPADFDPREAAKLAGRPKMKIDARGIAIALRARGLEKAGVK